MAGTRERIVTASAELFRRQGLTGTGMKEIVERAAAPYGSIYHFFPGGKDELAEQVVRSAGAGYQQLVLAVLESVADPLASLTNAFDVAAEGLVASDYADACPIATLALEVAGTHEPLRLATSEVFEAWVAAGAGWFGRWTGEEETARWLARSLVMLLEGAFLLSRAARDPEPLRDAGRAMVELARPRVGVSSPGGRGPASTAGGA